MTYVCPRCGNSSSRYIGYRNGKPYCRKCISFRGEELTYKKKEGKEAPLNLHYSLSQEQAKLSEEIVSNYKKGIDTLVYAVCGAGKTEISYAVISYAIFHGLTVGFALPRRDVVIELFWRLKEAFPQNKIVAVYGQHTKALEGDVIILTTHQLFRYKDYFDLLVMDEIDAFPFKGNEVLQSLYHNSVRGHSVLMSATPSEEVLQEFRKEGHAIVELRTRFHKKEIPVPRMKKIPNFFLVPYLIYKLRKYQAKNKPVFIFAPTINLCETIYQALSLFVKGGACVHSKKENRAEIIGDFKKNQYFYLVTTSVLERGVTFKNLQVIVTYADREDIYSSSTLIQIAGRVGRKIDAPDGDVIFLCEKENESMRRAINEIQFCNTFL